MKKGLSFLLTLVMVLTGVLSGQVGIVSQAANSTKGESTYRNVAYYASWAGYARGYAITDMDFSKITHLNFAFANLKSDGSVVVGDEWIDTQMTSGIYSGTGFNWEDAEAGMAGHFGALKKIKAQYPDLKTLISIGGWTWSTNFSDVAADAAKRQKMADTAVDFVVKYGFDGVDIDWEYPVEGGNNITHRASDKQNYTLMVKAIREALDAQGAKDGKTYYLTIAGGANPTFVKNTELKEMMKYLDWINIMTYDYHGAFDAKTNFNAPLYLDPADNTGTDFSIDASVKAYLNAGLDPKDLNLGLAFYGRGWVNVNASGTDALYHAGSSTSATGLDSGTWEGCCWDYWDIKANYIGKRGYVRYWNDVAKCPYLYSPQTKTFITYDDEESINIKLDYLMNKGLGGAMFWEASGDKYGDLLTVVSDRLGISNGKVVAPEEGSAGSEQGGNTETPEEPEQGGGTETPEEPGQGGSTETPDNPEQGDNTETPDNPGQNDADVIMNATHFVTGYWQNFDNGATCLKISDVPAAYNLIAVAFADATTTPGEVVFQLDSTLCSRLGGYTEAQFIEDIKAAKDKGQKVIISVGGEIGNVSVTNQTQADTFANSVYAMMQKYGFDGVDIDLEHGINSTYMSNALRKLSQLVGEDLIITMAPQTLDMQSTGTEYFKLALSIKDILTVVNTQYYNSGSMLGQDQQVYSQGTVDFLTALAAIQLENGLRPDQVGIGVPASPKGAGSGYVDPSIVNQALNCLAKGEKGGNYKPVRTYPGLRGAMTWSINWDASNGYNFLKTVAPVVAALPNADGSASEGGDVVIPENPGQSDEPGQGGGTETPEEPGQGEEPSVDSSDIPEWNASSVYVNGDRVVYNGKVYKAKWWNQGTNPETQGPWGPWECEGVAGEGSTGMETPGEQEEPSQGGETQDPGQTDTPNQDDDTDGYTEWNASSVYVGGDYVTYHGVVYKAKWWTQGDNPETQGPWGPWERM